MPKVKDYDELNDYLRQCCLKKLGHRVAGKTETIAERFEQDKASALALPRHAFDPYVPAEVKVDKYQTIRFENNRYSVPRRWAFEHVTVKAYALLIKYFVVSSIAKSFCLLSHYYPDMPMTVGESYSAWQQKLKKRSGF